MAKGIRRLVELILDRKAAKDMEREAQDALQKGTDPKKPEQNLSRVDKAMDRLKSAALKVGAALAAAFALNKIKAFGAEAVRQAMQSQDAWSNLSGTIEALGGSWADLEEKYRSAAATFEKVTVYGDDDFASGVQRLTSLTGNAALSFENMGLAADVAARFYKGEMAPAIEIVGRALTGQTRQLRQLGIVAETAEEGLAELARRTSGAAADRMNTFAGRVQQLGVAWANFQKAVGFAMIEAGGGTSILDTLIGAVRSLTDWTVANAKAISFWVGGGLKVAIGTLRVLFDTVRRTGDLFRGVFQVAIASVVGHFANMADASALAIRGIARLNDLIGRDNAAAKWNAYADSIERTASRLREFSERGMELGMSNIGGAFKPGAASAQTPRAATGGATGATEGGGAAAAEAVLKQYAATIATLAPKIVGPAVREGMIGALDNDEARRRMADAAGVWIEVNQNMIGAAQNAAMGVMGVWSDAFANIVRDGQEMGSALEEVGRGMAGAMLGGLAQLAAAKVAENVARSIEGIGIGLTGNPAGFAAAKVFAAAATKWAALGALAGAAQSVVAGSGRGGVSGGIPSGAYDPAGRMIDRASGPTAEIHIQVDGIDPLNPRHQNLLHHTAKSAGERYGGTVFVNGRRR
jgi:hypothetical protein